MGNAVCEWVKGIFAGNPIDTELNNTLIVLIPKTDHPEDFSQLRLVSAYQSLFNIV